MRYGHLLKQILLLCVCLFVLNEQAIADSRTDAMIADEAGDHVRAAQLYLSLANQGDAHAQVEIGDRYRYGQGVPKSKKEAVKYFRLAAEQGDAGGLLSLGIMYGWGEGVPQDTKEAEKYFLLAAKKGAEQGGYMWQYELGERYLKGDGIPKNYVLAYMWGNIAIVTVLMN